MRYTLIEFREITEPAYTDLIEEWEKSGERLSPSAIDRKGRNFAEQMSKWNFILREKPLIHPILLPAISSELSPAK